MPTQPILSKAAETTRVKSGNAESTKLQSGNSGPNRTGSIRSGTNKLSHFRDVLFRSTTLLFGFSVILLIGWVGIGLFQQSSLSRAKFGWGMLSSSTWDVPREVYGALPYIYGTLVSSLIALVIAIPLGIGAAIFLAEIAPRWLAAPLSFLIELLAAVPSVIFGLWGFKVLCPWLQASISPWLIQNFGTSSFFQGPAYITNMLAAGVVLAAMILPLITSISREVIRALPYSLREGSYALGATRWEAIRGVVLPAARSGMIGSVILGFGRAVGETMAVVMVIGNNPQIKASVLQPAYTMPALLANEFNEAFSDPMQRSSLLEIAFILFVITLIINALARILIMFTTRTITTADTGNPGLTAFKKIGAISFRLVGAALLAAILLIQVTADVRRAGMAALHSPVEILVILVVSARLGTHFTHGTQFWIRWRKLNNNWMHLVLFVCAVASSVILGMLLYYVFMKGFHALKPSFFTHLPTSPDDPNGGMKNGILGTLELVGLASLVGIPVGILGGIYLAEFGKGKLGFAIRFSADVLNGIPSVVIGMFAYAAFVLPLQQFSAWSGGAALGIMMIPTIMRTTEEMLRLVPTTLREASVGLGASQMQMVLGVVLPVARAGVITGIMLAIARIAGETAPLLFTAFGNEQISTKLTQPISSMTLMIYKYATTGYAAWVDQAWAGALVLLLLVMGMSLIVRIATRNKFSLA